MKENFASHSCHYNKTAGQKKSMLQFFFIYRNPEKNALRTGHCAGQTDYSTKNKEIESIKEITRTIESYIFKHQRLLFGFRRVFRKKNRYQKIISKETHVRKIQK